MQTSLSEIDLVEYSSIISITSCNTVHILETNAGMSESSCTFDLARDRRLWRHIINQYPILFDIALRSIISSENFVDFFLKVQRQTKMSGSSTYNFAHTFIVNEALNCSNDEHSIDELTSRLVGDMRKK